MPEGFDGVERGSSAGGHEAEDDANGGGKHEGNHVDFGVEQKRRANDFGQRDAQPVGEKNPADASDARESDGLDQELQQHLAGPCVKRLGLCLQVVCVGVVCVCGGG